MKSSIWFKAIFQPQMWLLISMFSMMVMELTLGTLWYQAIFRTVTLPWLALFGILGVISLISYGIARIMQNKHWPVGIKQCLFFIWLITVMLTSLRIMVFQGRAITLWEMLLQPVKYITLQGSNSDSFFHLLVIGLFVWRGVSMANSLASLRYIQVSFQLGLIMLLIYGVAFAPSHPIEASSGLYIYLFFALVSMSTARIASLSSERGGKLPRFGFRWLGNILLAGSGVVATAVFTGWVMGSRVIAWILQILVYILTAITALFLSIFAPIITLLARAVIAIVDLINSIFSKGSAIKIPKFLEDLVVQFGFLIQQTVPYLVAGRGVILAVILLLVIGAILFGLRFRSLQRSMLEEPDISNLVQQNKPGLLRRLAQRLLPGNLNFRFRRPGQILAAARIRQIYRQLITHSHTLGLDRSPSVTPFEFISQLERLYPDHLGDLEKITGAYVRIRYGEYPETLDEVDEVQHAWDAIRRNIKQGKKSL